MSGGGRIVEEYRAIFKRGVAVEVSSEDQGLRGSWYTGNVVRSIDRRDLKICVEYHNLYTQESGGIKLREYVKAVLVRPIPPLEPNPVFNLMDDVDAFHRDGWWEGVVTNVLPQSTYSVFFRCSREQIDFPASDLRLHREWISGNNWVPPVVSPPPSIGQKRNNGDSGGRSSNGNGNGNGSGRKTRKVGIRDDITSTSKQVDGGGGGVVMNNEGVREATRSRNRNASVVGGRMEEPRRE